MPLGGGNFKYFNKILPGTYTRTKTRSASGQPITSGITAGALNLDWGPDGEVFSITADDFTQNAELRTGYSYSAPENTMLREIFCHANELIGYRLNSGTKAESTVGKAKYSGKAGNNVTVSVLSNINNEAKVDVTTYFNEIERETQTVDKAGLDEIKTSKGKESKGVEVKPTFLENYGFVDTKENLPKVSGLSGVNLDSSAKNMFFFRLLDTLENGENYSAIVEVDGTKYALPLWNLKPENRNVYLWLGDDDVTGTFKLDGENWSANQTPVDVTGKTVKVSLYGYGKKVTAATLKSGPTEKIIDEVEVTCTGIVEKGEAYKGTPASATIAFEDNTVKVTFADIPDGYTASTQVKVDGELTNYIPGKLEDVVSGLEHVITYSTGAPTDGQMTVEAVLTKDGISQVIKSCTYTLDVTKDVTTGADATQLKDNDFVEFVKTGVLEENVAYTFAGGTTKPSITLADHVKALNALEPYSFQAMFCDSTDETVKALYVENVKRLASERGKYYLLYVNDYLEADCEFVVSVKNSVTPSEFVNSSALVAWSAGYSSAIDLWQEMTNKVYDGELDVDTNYTPSQLEQLMLDGNFVFHKTAIDEISTLVDYNCLQTFTEEHNEELINNKVIRILNYIQNEEARILNKYDIGSIKNTDEGRATVWNDCINILQPLSNNGALRNFDSSLVEVKEITGDIYSLQIDQVIEVEGTIRKIYITTYVVA